MTENSSKKLTHLDDAGKAIMVDVSHKSTTLRVAVVEGDLLITPEHRLGLVSNKKGDPLAVAEIAGIMAGKRCSELVPLCHQVPLSSLKVEVKEMSDCLKIRATASSMASTGVEMEAFVAVSIAGVTLIDMLKGISHDLVLSNIHLISKTGGKSDVNR